MKRVVNGRIRYTTNRRCADCSAPLSRPDAERCKPCANHARGTFVIYRCGRCGGERSRHSASGLCVACWRGNHAVAVSVRSPTAAHPWWGMWEELR